MKKNILLFLTFVALSLNAQIKINYNGNIGIGPTKTSHAIDLNISNNTLRFEL